MTGHVRRIVRIRAVVDAKSVVIVDLDPVELLGCCETSLLALKEYLSQCSRREEDVEAGGKAMFSIVLPGVRGEVMISVYEILEVLGVGAELGVAGS